MKKVLLTGMSGVGKSAVTSELSARGYRAFDTDYDGLSEMVSVSGDEPTGLGPGRDWVWREDRIQSLLSSGDQEALFICGCSPNQGKFYPQFDHVLLLTAPSDLIAERLRTRTNNPYGKREEEIARTLGLKETIEPLLRKSAGYEIDTSIPLDRVVSEVLRLAGLPDRMIRPGHGPHSQENDR